MLAENCGSVHKVLISYAKKMASLRASDTAWTQLPQCQKIITMEYWFRVSGRAPSALAFFYLRVGELPTSKQDCPTERSIVWYRSVKSCGSAPTRACIAAMPTAFIGLNCP